MSEQIPASNEKNAPKIGAEAGEREATLERLKSLAAVLKEASLPDAFIQETGLLSSGIANVGEGAKAYLDDHKKLVATVSGQQGRNSELQVSINLLGVELGYPLPQRTNTEAQSVRHGIEAADGIITVRTEVEPATGWSGPGINDKHPNPKMLASHMQPGETVSSSIYDKFDLSSSLPTVSRYLEENLVDENHGLNFQTSESPLSFETIPEHTLEFIADTLEATLQAMNDPDRWKTSFRPVQ